MAQIKPANAGTGPYMAMLLWGTGSSSDMQFRVRTDLAFFLASLKNKAKDARIRRQDVWQLTDLAERAGLGSLDEVESLRSALVALVPQQQPGAIGPLVDALMTEVLAAAYESFEDHPESHLGSKTSVLKWGALFARTASYEFQTLTHSPGETRGGADGGGTRHTFFVTGSALVPAHGAGLEPTARVGGGALVGNPERWVAGVAAATFFSPHAVDLEANVTWRLGRPDKPVSTLTTVAELDRKVRPRILVDHVRARDIWVSAGARQISYPGSAPGQDATLYDFAVTYAFPDRIHALGTMLTVSRIECANKSAQVDEWGAEFRWPTTGADQPTYFSARYGTRGQYTLAFEAKF